MSKMGEKFTEEKAREYEDRGANRSDELAGILTITEMSHIISALGIAHAHLDGKARYALEFLALRRVMCEARAVAEHNEYAGDYDYPETAS